MTRTWRYRGSRNTHTGDWLAERLAEELARPCACGHGRMAHAVDGPCDCAKDCGCQRFAEESA